jgi:hypothetical protein
VIYRGVGCVVAPLIVDYRSEIYPCLPSEVGWCIFCKCEAHAMRFGLEEAAGRALGLTWQYCGLLLVLMLVGSRRPQNLKGRVAG